MLKKILKEFGRFILSVLLFGLGDFLFLKIGCGRAVIHYTPPEGCVFCPPPSGIFFCNTKPLHILCSLMALFLVSFFVWKKKLSKVWLVDLVIILVLFHITNIVVDYAMEPIS